MKNNHLPLVKIIKTGTVTLEASELSSTFNVQIKAGLGIGGGSSVTLIEADCKILVDTGFDYEWLDTPDNDNRNSRNLVNALNEQDITPDAIDIVFITHWHRDHFGNIGLFKKARYIASRPLLERYKPEGFTGIDDREEIVKGVSAIYTPGHTAEHASILVNTTLGNVKARVAVAGDAVISNSYFQAGQIWNHNADFYSLDEAKKSVLSLVDGSDLIIPGHGVPFMTYKPEWIAAQKDISYG